MFCAEIQMSLSKLTKIPNDRFTTFDEQKSALDIQFAYLAESINLHELNLGFDHP